MKLNKYNSFEELKKSVVLPNDTKQQSEKVQSDVLQKVKETKVKPMYTENDIVFDGKQLKTKDENYETYSKGLHTSWTVTIIGIKNGAKDIGNNINDGYLHNSFKDKSRAAQLLVNLINSK